MEQIGIIGDGTKLKIDPARLVDTRALIQGSSGSGKSWLVRLLVEKVAAKIPVLILDLEGEFVTLSRLPVVAEHHLPVPRTGADWFWKTGG